MRAGIEWELESKADQRLFEWFGKEAQLLKIKAEAPGMWSTVCVFDDCVSLL